MLHVKGGETEVASSNRSCPEVPVMAVANAHTVFASSWGLKPARVRCADPSARALNVDGDVPPALAMPHAVFAISRGLNSPLFGRRPFSTMRRRLR